jgi:enhancing lycopene biosynthesis protein 2
MSHPPRVALVLSGCGVYDGSEIQEAVACIFALSKAGAHTGFFAPDKDQAHVIDHRTGQPADETRNVLTEAARIARGDIAPLADLAASDFDAVIFPGGFGAAKNLCSFAFDGDGMSVDADAERVINDFRAAGKPIGMCCIAPVLAAKVLSTPDAPATVTLGAASDASAAAEAMGATHAERAVTEIAVDDANALTTAPAYMYGEAAPHEVQEGIEKMVASVLERVGVAAGS